MTVREIAIAATAFVLGGVAQSIVAHYVLPNTYRLHAWRFARRNHRRYGVPSPADQVLDRDGFSLGYSYKYKSALWVVYVLNKQSVRVDTGRSEAFYPDTDLPESHRTRLDDFANTGYDKGHLAPSAAINFTRRSNQQTFALSNIALQDPRLNRQAWSKIEALEREWVFTLGKVAVCTGPIFTQRPRRVNGIAVPKAFFKVAYSFAYRRYIGFILPNEPVRASEVWQYALSVHEVEKATGYRFFERIIDGDRKDLNLKFWKEAHL